jgi:cobalamin biosynthesis protein CbiG
MPGVRAYTPADLARILAERRLGTPSTRDVVVDGERDRHGRPVKIIVDQLGNLVRERWTGQDAFVFLPHLKVRWRPIVEEER